MVGGCGLVGGWGLREGSLLLVHGSSGCLALRRSQTTARFGDFAVKRRCAGFAVTKKSLREAGNGSRGPPRSARPARCDKVLALVGCHRRGLRAVAQLGSALDWGSRGRRFKSCQPDRLALAYSCRSGLVSCPGLATGDDSERRLRGTSLGPPLRERGSRVQDSTGVGVQVAARDGWVLVSSHPLEHVQLDPSVRHPCERSVPETVAYEPLQA